MQFKEELWSESGRVEATREVGQDGQVAGEAGGAQPRKDLNQRIEELVPDRTIDVIVYYEDPRALAHCVFNVTKALTPGIRPRLVIARSLSTAEPIPEGSLLEDVPRTVVTAIEPGYSHGVQAALNACLSPWVVVLSEHARVFDGWLNHLLDAVDEKTAIVAALSNRVVLTKPGMSAGMMARSIASSVVLRGTPVAFPMETCLLLSKKLVEEAGGLDLASYAPGGGDFLALYLRLVKMGYEARYSERCWVFDESATRAGGHVWEPDSRKGFARFITRHGDEALALRKQKTNDTWMKMLASEFQPESCRRPDVVFVLREAVVCGLVLAITEICNSLNRTGRWNAYFICTSLEPDERSRLPLGFEPVVVESEVMTRRYIRQLRGAVIIATLTATAEDVLDAVDLSNHHVYFLQDDERTFRHVTGAFYREAEQVEKMWQAFDRRVVNSAWLKRNLQKLNLDSTRIGIGVDLLRFRPGAREHVVPRIMVHCRPSTPRRGWPFIKAVLNRVARSRPVDIITYDERPEGLDFRTAVSDLGKVAPWELALYMGAADVFLEGSEQQGWGMQSLEAMSAGCALVSTDNLGVREFGTAGKDCVFVPHGDVELAAAVICHLLDHPEERVRFSVEARQTATAFGWDEVGKAWDAYLSKVARR